MHLAAEWPCGGDFARARAAAAAAAVGLAFGQGKLWRGRHPFLCWQQLRLAGALRRLSCRHAKSPLLHNYTATMCNSHLGSPAPNQKNKSPITVDGINNSMPGDPTAWGLERGARARATFCTEGRHRSCCGTPIVRQRLELSPVVWGHGSVCALRARTHRSIAATCRTLTLTVFVNADLRCVPDTGHARLRRSRRSVNVV